MPLESKVLSVHCVQKKALCSTVNVITVVDAES